MLDPLSTLLEKSAIESVLYAYARACDERNWLGFDDIFCTDVAVDYGGEFILHERAAVVAMIRSMLGGCGPTQHLLGNIDIRLEGDRAQSRCYVRAAHAGRGEEADLLYEVWAEYHDTLVCLPVGWRILHRRMVVHKEIGSRAVLKAAP